MHSLIWVLLALLFLTSKGQGSDFCFDPDGGPQTVCVNVPSISTPLKVVPSTQSSDGSFTYPDSDTTPFEFDDMSDEGTLIFRVAMSDILQLPVGSFEIRYSPAGNGTEVSLTVDYALGGTVVLQGTKFSVGTTDFVAVGLIYSTSSGVDICDAANFRELNNIFETRVFSDLSCDSGNRGKVEVRAVHTIDQDYQVVLAQRGNCNDPSRRSDAITLTPLSNVTEPPPTTPPGITDQLTTTMPQPGGETNIAAIVASVIIIAALIIPVSILGSLVGLWYFKKCNSRPGRNGNGSGDKIGDTAHMEREVAEHVDNPHQFNGDLVAPYGGPEEQENLVVVCPNSNKVYSSLQESLADILGLKLVTNGVNSNCDPCLQVLNRMRDGRCWTCVMWNGNGEQQNGIKDHPVFQLLHAFVTRSIDQEFMRKVFFVHFGAAQQRVLLMKPEHVRFITRHENPDSDNFDPTSCAKAIAEQVPRNFESSVKKETIQNSSTPATSYRTFGTPTPSHPSVTRLLDEHRNPSQASSQNGSPSHSEKNSTTSLPQLQAIEKLEAAVKRVEGKVEGMDKKLDGVDKKVLEGVEKLDGVESSIGTRFDEVGQKVEKKVEEVGQKVEKKVEEVGEKVDKTQETLEDIGADVEDIGGGVEDIRLERVTPEPFETST